MEGGNAASNGRGITQFAEGEPKRRYYQTPLILPNRNAGITKYPLIYGYTNVLFAINWQRIGLWLYQRFVRRSGECVIPFADAPWVETHGY